MFNVAKAFSQEGDNIAKGLPKGVALPDPISKELASIASSFKELQEARHTADYDVLKQFGPIDADALVQKAEKAFKDWNVEKSSRNTPIFLAALIFGRDWNK